MSRRRIDVLAQPVDLRKEAVTVDVVCPSLTAHLVNETKSSQQTVGKRSATPISIVSHNTEAENERRWVEPPSTVPTHFGTECSLETCDMCPTFPGCGGGKANAGKVTALQNWAQPPMEKRDEIAGKPIGIKGDWQQPPIEVRREAYFEPVLDGTVNVGIGPQCSTEMCELCPDFPGCENRKVDMTPKA